MSKMRHGRGWIADKLMDLRKESGMTLEQVAKESGISISTLSNYENGNSEPNVYVLEDILAAYECDIGDFLHTKPTGYGQTLKVFQTYGLDKDFLKELKIQKLLSRRNMSYNMVGVLNRIAKYPMECERFYTALENFFDYSMHERLTREIRHGTCQSALGPPDQATQRMLLEPAVEALIGIFNLEYADKQVSALKELSQMQTHYSKKFRSQVVNIMRGKWKKNIL